MIHDKQLKAGRYIICVVPKWNKQASFDPLYKQVRTGVYSPDPIKLEKCERENAYQALSCIFKQFSEEKANSELEPLKELPPEYKNGCYKDLEFKPISGMFGYMAFRNNSKILLEQKMQI